MGRVTAAVLLLLDFLPFLKCRMKLNVNKTRTKGKKGRMSSAGGDSNPPCYLPYMAFIMATNVGEKQTA